MKRGYFSSIEFRIITLITAVMLFFGVFIVYFMYYNQRSNLIQSAERGIYLNTETLLTMLRNMMLDGKAPLLVRSMYELGELSDYKSISIYRTNGTLAFSDYSTLNAVNSRQKKIRFEKTPRIEDIRSAAQKEHITRDVTDTIESGSPKQEFYNQARELEYYYPIVNQSECMACHANTFPYRGVINYRLSLAATYRQINDTGNFITVFFIAAGIFMVSVLIILFRYLFIRPLKKIGSAIERLGRGDFNARCGLKQHDELGSLAEQIDLMIKGLEERFILGKYVSGSTIDQVQKGGGPSGNVTRKSIIVMFSDIRSFTPYAEAHPPEIVIENLNRVLEVQAEAVEQCGGDVDKFIGDAIMAVFSDESVALRCAFDMIGKVKSLGLGLEIGIGINKGEAISGNIGSKNRREYAVIGDTVNVASRLCSLARPGGTVLTSGDFFGAVKDESDAVLLKGQRIKGRKQLMDIYRINSVKVKS